jgi:hypothetical protein
LGRMLDKFNWLLVSLVALTPTFAAPIVNLNSASSFGLLGGSVSNTGTSVVTGNVGVQNAGGTISGFNPTGTTVGGTVIAPGGTLSNNAFVDFVNAFDAANLLSSTQSYADLTVNRTFFGNNVYTFTLPNISTTTGISLTFDAQNDPNQVFVIRTAGALTVHIFWIVGTAATISTGSSGPITFDGNILAGSSFTMSAAAGGSGTLAGTINGCVFSETANTLAGTTNVNGCTGASVVPEPASIGLLGLGCLAGVLARRRPRS